MAKEIVQLRWPLAALAVSVLALAGGVWVCGAVLDEDIASWSLQFYQYLIAPVFAAMVPSQSLQQETVVAGIALTVAGLVLFLGFLTGARGVMISLVLLVLGLNLATMFALGEGSVRAHLRALQAFLATPAGATATVGLGAAVMVLAYLGSVAVFARRDLTRLPQGGRTGGQ